MSTSSLVLAEAVRAVPRERGGIDSLPHGAKIFLVGCPEDWNAVFHDVRLRPFEVCGKHDLRMGGTRFLWRERLERRLRRVGDEVAIVYVGRLSKRWFDGPPARLARCHWLDMPGERHQRGKFPAGHLDAHEHELRRVFDALADDDSRRTYASCIRARRERDAGFLRLASYREYDHPLARAAAGEVVFDVGAFDGESSLMFLRQVGLRGRVVALEPSESSRGHRMMRLARRLGVTVVPVAASDRRGRAAFSEGGAGSSIRASGTETVELAPIDELVSELRLSRLDVLKLDVEGHEAPALRGAREAIQRFRPKLHVSIYHKARDLFELPAYLMETLDDYAFYVGQHNCWDTETDLYAVPRERVGAR